MKVFKIYLSIFLLVILWLIPLDIFCQNEDINVEFSFQTPNKFVCEIQNATKYPISMLLSKEEAEGNSDLFFDIVKFGSEDTIRYVSYGLMKNVNSQSQILRLDSGQIYTILYNEYFPKRFIKAYIYIKYSVLGPAPISVEYYINTFDLDEIRNRKRLGNNNECGKTYNENN